ncbi:mannose-1-phosphate guanylyltransferase/mannose-1-phosphate guanylyltransferase/phosphomannomutase [Prosthecobacter fusiformis]|uniref:Mannose-1-phosphate guanylyltransferase/mannose-1-phosphate guanylyltransferase/phosphomannomutase n=1 Tax=Prosthecobacter fusiformis TaxID=48464 RepID=A0A4R7SQB2_9BACT|nr:nucleotidyltransferase family protein [Prosthecobacter fusiformis]TDU81211.1 mannose-1-phosphate guanylyltransferase/mannose-1-phosphate guanylyltransferase/phosphomannomutase [Prosthecobacter fusiformis]
MQKAFVLGAGLGERLRPLTAQLPKPLIPVFHQPLITYAFDHLLAAGVTDFVVNTHHIPEAYAQAFPEGRHRAAPIAFRNESPVRLETAGGIANVRDLLADQPFIVYNGDILTDLPLQPLLKEHQEKGNLVTLVLRSSGPALHISYDETTGLVTDIRNKLGTGREGEYLFTGIYACQPEIHEWLTPGKVESVIPIFLRMIQEGARLGAVVIDEGHWWDLGSRAAYLEAHQALHQLGTAPAPAIHPTAQVSPQAVLLGLNVIGAGAVVEAGAVLEDCILWPESTITTGAHLKQCIIRKGIRAEGQHTGVDL